MWSAFDGNKKRDASVGYDKSASIMRFLNWHNKTPVDVFSFCAKKLIYEGLSAVRCLCCRCAFYSVLCVICVLAVCSPCHLENHVRCLYVEHIISCHSAPHTESGGSLSDASLPFQFPPTSYPYTDVDIHFSPYLHRIGDRWH